MKVTTSLVLAAAAACDYDNNNKNNNNKNNNNKWSAILFSYVAGATMDERAITRRTASWWSASTSRKPYDTDHRCFDRRFSNFFKFQFFLFTLFRLFVSTLVHTFTFVYQCGRSCGRVAFSALFLCRCNGHLGSMPHLLYWFICIRSQRSEINLFLFFFFHLSFSYRFCFWSHYLPVLFAVVCIAALLLLMSVLVLLYFVSFFFADFRCCLTLYIFFFFFWYFS